MISVPYMFLLVSAAADAALVAASFFAAFWLRFRSGWIPGLDAPSWESYARDLWVLVPLYLIMFRYAGLYRVRRGVSGADELSRIARAVAVAAVASAAVTFVAREFLFSRLVLGITALLTGLTVWVARRFLRGVQVMLRRRGVLGLTRLLVVGSGEAARSMLRRLKDNPALGYQVIGAIAESPHVKEVEGVPVAGTLSAFTKVMAALRPDEVLFALPAQAHSDLIPLLVELQDTPVKYRIVSDLFGLITNPVEADEILGVPVFEMKEAPLNIWYNRAVKRVFDSALSAVAVLVALPFFPVVALAVKLTSPGPVLFKQKRVGRDGKAFTMYKFRSMRTGSETAAFTQANDPRRTAFGAFLRRTSLDELPQLYNVLQGRMSLVGPRPEIPALVKKFEQSVPRYFERHQAKAGITGWAQVHGLRGNTSIEERVRYDIYYIENWSLWLDLRILARTVLDIFDHEHAY